MSARTLQKWHGAGNDFLVEVTDNVGASWWTPERAIAACDRHTGVGADGMIVGAQSDGRVVMTLYNADGSVAEVSGNGLRCLGAAIARRVLQTGEVSRVITTGAGERNVHVNITGDTGTGEVDMGDVVLTSGDEMVDGVHVYGRATVGNPHVVVADDATWTDDQRGAVAHTLAGATLTANVEFVRIESPSRVAITVVERGVGWTRACGTGSVAVTAVLHKLGLADTNVVVANPGGDLTVTLEGSRAKLGGPVTHVADVMWSAA
jgi:diaminopimelate epimerase